MSLVSLKKRLNIDQRNLMLATVVQDSRDVVTVRTTRGEQVKAMKPDGAQYAVGAMLELRTTDGRTYIVNGPAAMAQTAGEYVIVE